MAHCRLGALETEMSTAPIGHRAVRGHSTRPPTVDLPFSHVVYLATGVYGTKSESMPTEHRNMANFIFKYFPAYYTSFETANACDSDAFMIHDQGSSSKE